MYGVRLYQKVTDDTNTTTRAFDRNWIFTAIMYFLGCFLSMIRIDGVRRCFTISISLKIQVRAMMNTIISHNSYWKYYLQSYSTFLNHISPIIYIPCVYALINHRITFVSWINFSWNRSLFQVHYWLFRMTIM